jgi:RNA polymerase sigma-70 factor (ECF subfamily)
MSKDVSEKVSLELALLAALDSIHAEVDISKIAEIKDWSRAVRGKFYGATVKDASDLSKLKAGLPPALSHAIALNVPAFSSGVVSGVTLGAPVNMASHGNVQYSQMATPQLIVVCTSESSEEAWSEFVRRSRPVITAAITKAARRFRNASHELVDDLIQEAFLKLCRDNFRALRGVATAHENAFYGFLKVVAAHVTVDHFRTTDAFKMGGGNELEAPEARRVFSEYELSRGSSSGLERKVLLEEIDRALRTHEHEPDFERDRAIFWLYYSQGLTAKEIAGLPGMKLTVNGIESILLRLTRRVRSALTKGTRGTAK